VGAALQAQAEAAGGVRPGDRGRPPRADAPQQRALLQVGTAAGPEGAPRRHRPLKRDSRTHCRARPPAPNGGPTPQDETNLVSPLRC
jgi:hypothetical protein